MEEKKCERSFGGETPSKPSGNAKVPNNSPLDPETFSLNLVHILFLRYILILSFHLYLGLACGLFPSRSLNVLRALPINFPRRATCSVHLIFVYMTTFFFYGALARLQDMASPTVFLFQDFSWGFETNPSFTGWGCQPHAQPPTWRTFIWPPQNYNGHVFCFSD
jgi:hypothetical protein